MSNSDYHLIAESTTNSALIPSDKLGAPGAPGTITILAIRENEVRDSNIRLVDQSPRRFTVELLLAKLPAPSTDINGAFTKDDGGSYIRAATGTADFRVQTSHGDFQVHLNDQLELSMIRMSVDARAPSDARNKVYDAVAPFLDHLAFLAGAPIATGLMKIYDEKHQATVIDLIGPERQVTLNSGGETLFTELAPIYTLYREFKNSNSAYYRLLCLFKIMEGILGPLRKNAREAAARLGISLSIPKERVPEHPDIPKDLRHLIGKPVKEFYDKILAKRYRDVVSHFLVRENVILQVSSAAERNNFSQMAFICDLCVRILISNHEALLRRLDAARGAET